MYAKPPPPPMLIDKVFKHEGYLSMLYSNSIYTLMLLLQESSLLRQNLIEAIMSVARATRSHSIVIIHGTSAWAELLNQQLQNYSQQHNDSLCLAGIYALHSKNTEELVGAISSTKLMVTEDIIKTLQPGTMAVLLLEDPEEIRAFLEVCQHTTGLVFLTVFHPWSIKPYAGNYRT